MSGASHQRRRLPSVLSRRRMTSVATPANSQPFDEALYAGEMVHPPPVVGAATLGSDAPPASACPPLRATVGVDVGVAAGARVTVGGAAAVMVNVPS